MAWSTRETEASPEMTDNRINSMTEEHLPSVINKVLDNAVQSYDQFMDSFLYLSKEDVEEYTVHESDEYPEYASIIRDVQLHVKTAETSGEPQDSCALSVNIDNQHSGTRENDDLEIEELVEETNSCTMPDHPLPQGKYVKVDNFLDEPHLSSDSDSEDSPLEDIDDLLGDVSQGGSAGSVKLTKTLKEYAEEADPSDNAPVQDQEGQQPLPGEVNQTAELPQGEITAAVTRLSVGTPSIAPPPGGDSETSAQQTDEVQPFTLDPDFDYDNVRLTPKWDNSFWMVGNDPT